MDEQAWLACCDPDSMLKFLQGTGKLTDRQARLFAVACCRRFHDGYSHPAVLVAERVADGLASNSELRAARQDIGGVGSYSSRASASNAVGAAVEAVATEAAIRASVHAANYFAHLAVEAVDNPVTATSVFIAHRGGEYEVQAAALRDIFGPLPFRSLTLPQSIRTWNDGCVVKLAAAAYEERQLPSGHLDPVRLGVLADALEESGADAVLVKHLREPGPHVRGCHAVDIVLGRS